MKIGRYMFIFNKPKGNLVKEIEITYLQFLIFKDNLIPLSDDPNLYRPYRLNTQLCKLLYKEIPELQLYPQTEYDIYSEACTIS